MRRPPLTFLPPGYWSDWAIKRRKRRTDSAPTKTKYPKNGNVTLIQSDTKAFDCSWEKKIYWIFCQMILGLHWDLLRSSLKAFGIGHFPCRITNRTYPKQIRANIFFAQFGRENRFDSLSTTFDESWKCNTNRMWQCGCCGRHTLP